MLPTVCARPPPATAASSIRIETPAELLRATLDALPSERLADLLEFLETGSSPLTREASRRREG